MSDQEQLDDSEPTPERQAELRAAYDANVAAGKAPYAGVRIRTWGELSWVMRERDWSGDFDAEGKTRADLSGADLSGANLSNTALHEANLSRASLVGTNLSDADLYEANLSHANFGYATLSGAILTKATLSGAELYVATLSGATLVGTDLSGATLVGTKLSDADLTQANLSHASLYRAALRGATLVGATLSHASLREAALSGADLRTARMEAGTNLMGAKLDAHSRLADVVWNGVPVTRLNWEAVDTLGDEWVAHQAKNEKGKPKGKATRLRDFQDAVLANRQVATLLRSQGLNEPADRFAYRAQVLQRQVLRRQRQWLRWLGSSLLDAVAGYGYRPMRSVMAYVLIVGLFTGAYLLNAQFAAPHLTWDEALVLSVSAFHGRGFFTTGISLGDTLARLAAGEAIIGLLIEITFIATFTQRFFAR